MKINHIEQHSWPLNPTLSTNDSLLTARPQTGLLTPWRTRSTIQSLCRQTVQTQNISQGTGVEGQHGLFHICWPGSLFQTQNV